jgi:Flp pilus assembly protein TadD
LCCAAFALTLERSVLFSNGILLFSDGTQKTEHSTDAPLLLGQSLESTGRVDEAMLAYAQVLARAASDEPDFARASNNMANVLARRGRLEEAERILRQALARFPHDEKVRRNLVKVLRGEGRTQAAEALEKEGN